MPRPVRQDIRNETIAEIKTIARQQMQQRGTTGLSLRQIAREMGITAPAIYNYFDSLDDLITGLIVDAFSAQADAMRQATEEAQTDDLWTLLEAAILAYRQWAVDHPTEFQLIYGNPIPGYEAPAEITTPLASRSFAVVIELYLRGWQEGILSIPPEYAHIPESIQQHLSRWKQQFGVTAPENLFHLLAVGWSRIHGMVMLELFQHSQGVIGDAEAFYTFETKVLLEQLGL